MPIVLQTIAREHMTDLFFASHSMLEELKEAVSQECEYQSANLAELQALPDADPKEIADYKKDIASKQNIMKLMNDRLNRLSQLEAVDMVSCLVMEPETTRGELSVCFDYIQNTLRSSSRVEEKLLGVELLEIFEAYKEQLKSQQDEVAKERKIPVLLCETHHCEVLSRLADYQRIYQKDTASAETKYDIFLTALTEQTKYPADAFLDRVCQDDHFVSPPTCLQHIRALYTAVLNVNMPKCSISEKKAVTDLKNAMDALIKEDKMPINGDDLMFILRSTAMAMSVQPIVKQPSLSYGFKMLMNQVCQTARVKPIFPMIAMVDKAMKMSFKTASFSLKRSSLTTDDGAVPAPDASSSTLSTVSDSDDESTDGDIDSDSPSSR